MLWTGVTSPHQLQTTLTNKPPSSTRQFSNALAKHSLCSSVIGISGWRGALENTAQPWQQDRAQPTPWRRTVPPRVSGLDSGSSCIMNLNRMINTHYVRNTHYRPTVDHTTIQRENIHPSSIATYRLGSGAPKEGHPDTVASELWVRIIYFYQVLH